MGRDSSHARGVFFKNSRLQFVVFCVMVLLLGNLSAIVDHFLHPEIPYFDAEHLYVGGITGLVSAVLIGLVAIYARHLEEVLTKLHTLEALLPICANCKKIRSKDPVGDGQEVWQSVESYISSRTKATFTHSICPGCMQKLYPEDFP